LFLTFFNQLTHRALKAISILIGGIVIDTFCERRKSFAHPATGSCTHLRGDGIFLAVTRQRQPRAFPLLSRNISSCHTIKKQYIPCMLVYPSITMEITCSPKKTINIFGNSVFCPLDATERDNYSAIKWHDR